MFGYVVANLDKLTPAQKERYRAVYCGLCRALRDRFGQKCRLTLSYDMAFFILLLSSLDRTELAEEKAFRCPLHPARCRTAYVNRHTLYAADLNVLLAYFQRMDDWEDERKVTALAQAKALGKGAEAARERHPDIALALDEGLKELHRLEQDGETNPDLPAAVFGQILGSVFAIQGHPQEDSLRAFGDSLGRFVYLMDAAVDLKKDVLHEKYNPLVAVDSSRHEGILQALMAACVEGFEALPVLRDRELMENILYSGVWTRYLAQKKGEARA